MRSCLIPLCAALSISGAVVVAQPPADRPLPEAARHHLDLLIGTWDARWEWLDETGEVAGVETGTETFSFLIEDRVVRLHTVVEGRPAPSEALLFYSFEDERLHLVSVDRDGTLWLLEGPEDGSVLTSESKTGRDGRPLTIRFTHGEEDDALTAVMEMSRDGGETWRVGFRQHMVRRPSTAAGISP